MQCADGHFGEEETQTQTQELPCGVYAATSSLLLGDLKHTQALVLLEELVLSPDLLPKVLQLQLLLLRAGPDPLHGLDELAHLHKLGPELVQHLVDILALLIYAGKGRGGGRERERGAIGHPFASQAEPEQGP